MIRSPFPSTSWMPMLDAEPLTADGAQAPPPGPHWDAFAQRELARALAAAEDWHTGLRNTIGALGEHGGWDVVTAWVADDHHPVLRCLSMWSARSDLREFENATWQARLALLDSELGHAFVGPGSVSMSDIGVAPDVRLRAAADRDMRSALLVPVRDGRTTIAALELLSGSATPADAELIASVEAVAIALAQFRRLLCQVASPLWRFGRF